MNNKKLIKRIAVASLACFLAIPTINTVPTQAKTVATVEYYENKIKEKESKIDKIKKSHDSENEKQQAIEGQLKQIEKYKESIKDIQNGSIIYIFDNEADLQNYKQEQAVEKAQRQAAQAAQKAAEQTEKDRIANTVYQIPAGVDNVYDFVPHFDDESKKTWGEEHKYERTDMPGIIFTLRCSYIPNSGKYGVTDVDPHFTISDFKSIKIKRYKDANSREIEYDYVKQFTYNYISPFDGFGGLTNGGFQASVGEDMRLATYTGGVAKINKGQNSFKVHSFWKQTDESGTVLFGGQGYTDRMNAFSAEAFEQAIKNHGINQSLTNNYRDALGESIENAKNWVKKWDDQGFNPIIEVTPYYGG